MLEMITASLGGKWAWGSAVAVIGVIFAVDPVISVSIIAVFGTAITAYFSYRQFKTEKKVEANHLFVDQLQEQLMTERGHTERIDSRVELLQAQVLELQVELNNYRMGVAILQNQIVGLDHTPVWPTVKR